MRAPIPASAMHVRNLTRASDITPAAVQYNQATHTALITFGAGQLLDGNYALTLNSIDFLDIAGNPLDGDGNGAAGGNFVFSFFRLLGDVNGDRSVNQADRTIVANAQGNEGFTGVAADTNDDGVVSFEDLVAVAQHYNTGNATRLGGDLNGDGLVGFSDLVAIAQNYNAVPMADLDRDGNVNSSDLAIVDANLGHSLPAPAAVALSPDIAAVSGVETPHSVPAALPMAAAAEPLVLHRKPARLEIVQAPSRLRTYSLRRIVSSMDSVFASDQAFAKELFGKAQLKSRHPA